MKELEGLPISNKTFYVREQIVRRNYDSLKPLKPEEVEMVIRLADEFDKKEKGRHNEIWGEVEEKFRSKCKHEFVQMKDLTNDLFCLKCSLKAKQIEVKPIFVNSEIDINALAESIRSVMEKRDMRG